MEKNHITVSFFSKKISSFVNIVLYILMMTILLQETSHASGWLGWATSITGIPGVTTAATTAGKTVVNMFVVPKEDVNTLKIRINDLDLDEVKNFCADKIVECNEKINQIETQYKDSVNKLHGTIQDQQRLENFWKQQYLQASIVINQVNDFFQIYHRLSTYFEGLKKKNEHSFDLINQDEKSRLNNQYNKHLNYIKDRRANLGAALYENFTYQGDGGVMSRYRKSANRKLNRENRWGVRSFSNVNYTSGIDDLLSESGEELDQQLNIFKTAYTRTLSIIRLSGAEIWNQYHPGQEQLYQQLGLTPDGLRPKMTFYIPSLNVNVLKSSAPRPIPSKKTEIYAPGPSSLETPKMSYTPPSDQRTRFPSDNQVPLYKMPETSSLMSTSVPTIMGSYQIKKTFEFPSNQDQIFNELMGKKQTHLNNTNYNSQDEEENESDSDQSEESEEEDEEDDDNTNEDSVVVERQPLRKDDASSF